MGVGQGCLCICVCRCVTRAVLWDYRLLGDAIGHSEPALDTMTFWMQLDGVRHGTGVCASVILLGRVWFLCLLHVLSTRKDPEGNGIRLLFPSFLVALHLMLSNRQTWTCSCGL